jgi:hypothetical protein
MKLLNLMMIDARRLIIRKSLKIGKDLKTFHLKSLNVNSYSKIKD